ncbi:MAG TPA: winged helix-turn-helix domain-containing protein [Segetibacter sp.]|nr:winged helix-turn-helix domain-containing protein [Segetibacter sp.]
MARKSRLTREVQEKSLEQRLKQVKGFWRVQRILVILSLHKQAQTSKDLSLQFNLSEIAIRKLVSAYNKLGEAVFEVKGQGGRNNASMSFEEEALFLKQFFDKALLGKISTAEEIRKAFIKKTGREKTAKSTIYDLLKRHGWSKKKARPVHPKSNKEAQETFKKTIRKKYRP